MKTKILCVVFISVSIVACGYIPVRTPFTLSDDSYDKEANINDSIRILNWNIHKEGNLSEWKKVITHIVKDKKPDFILLQEVRLDGKVGDFISKDLKYGWEFSPNLYQGKYDAYSGVLTASHIKPKMVESALSNGTELFSKIQKTVLFTKYPIGSPSLELLVVNIHGININIDLDGFKEQIRYIAEVVMRHDGPVILAGDFNTWKEARLDHLSKLVKEMELVKIDFGSNADYVETMFGNPLDHIFISKEKLEVIKGSQDVIVDIKSSDHSPLFVELRIRQ
ncbi:MAG: endonuclease/exonuclease/phosphatase family protein [Desulfobacteraceae bacterium]|nr:endonuclease/exonuclease/phosphatase family protein [Desulfobacteraceae bacterium]